MDWPLSSHVPSSIRLSNGNQEPPSSRHGYRNLSLTSQMYLPARSEMDESPSQFPLYAFRHLHDRCNNGVPSLLIQTESYFHDDTTPWLHTTLKFKILRTCSASGNILFRNYACRLENSNLHVYLSQTQTNFISSFGLDHYTLQVCGINPLNAELNPICYLMALLGAHHFLHVSRIRVKPLTLKLLMSYIYIWSTYCWCF